MSTRPLKKPTYRGRWMPSFETQHLRSEKPRLLWVPGTQSTKEQKRNLRSKARVILDSTDRRIVDVGARVVQSVLHEPDPEFTVLHLYCAALDMSRETGETWATCMTYLMDKFDGAIARQQDTDGDTTQRPKPSFFRRLLRTLTPRALRARDAATPEASVDQPPRAGNVEHRHAS